MKVYRPENWVDSERAWSATLYRSIFLLGTVLVLTGALAFGTYHEHLNANLHQTAREHLEESNVEVLELRMDYRFHWWYRSPHRMSIRAANPPDDLAERLHSHLKKKRNRLLEIRVIEQTVDVAGENE